MQAHHLTRHGDDKENYLCPHYQIHAGSRFASQHLVDNEVGRDGQEIGQNAQSIPPENRSIKNQQSELGGAKQPKGEDAQEAHNGKIELPLLPGGEMIVKQHNDHQQQTHGDGHEIGHILPEEGLHRLHLRTQPQALHLTQLIGRI